MVDGPVVVPGRDLSARRQGQGERLGGGRMEHRERVVGKSDVREAGWERGDRGSWLTLRIAPDAATDLVIARVFRKDRGKDVLPLRNRQRHLDPLCLGVLPGIQPAYPGRDGSLVRLGFAVQLGRREEFRETKRGTGRQCRCARGESEGRVSGGIGQQGQGRGGDGGNYVGRQVHKRFGWCDVMRCDFRSCVHASKVKRRRSGQIDNPDER